MRVNAVYEGDCLDVLKQFPDNCIDTIITDPPRDHILIEKEPEYVEICKRRIAEYTGQEIAPVEIELIEEQKVKQLGLW